MVPPEQGEVPPRSTSVQLERMFYNITMPELSEPWVSYFVGLSQTDGHLRETTRNRGRLSIELGRRDEDVLLRLAQLIPCATHIDRRTRETNFARRYDSTILNLHAWEMRKLLKAWGVPVGRKSADVAPPIAEYSEVDYVRGLVDGDGSLGTTGKGLPFVSLNTSSDRMAEYFIDFIHRATGKPRKRNNRNRRDHTYNIVVFREDAVLLARLLYYEGCVSLERKRRSAERMKAWVRPPRMKRRPEARRWLPEEDKLIQAHPVEESARRLARTEQSVRTRLRKLSRTRHRILSP